MAGSLRAHVLPRLARSRENHGLAREGRSERSVDQGAEGKGPRAHRIALFCEASIAIASITGPSLVHPSSLGIPSPINFIQQGVPRPGNLCLGCFHYMRRGTPSANERVGQSQMAESRIASNCLKSLIMCNFQVTQE